MNYNNFVKSFAAALILLVICGVLRAQTFQNPIPGNIYGQSIVACTGGNTPYEYAATGGAIYARTFDANSYYIKVFSTPGSLQIVSFAVQHKNDNYYRVVLLKDGNGNFYSVYGKIKALSADSIITGPVILPAPFSGKYIKVIAGGALYAYSFLSGGPPGNLTASYDNGLTWQDDTLGIGYDNVYDAAADTSGNLFIAGGDGIYKQLSDDSVWSRLNDNTYNASKIFVDARNRILVSNYGINTHISLDGGGNFIGDSIGISGKVTSLAGDKQGNLYALAGGNIYRNTGGISNWGNISNSFNSVAGSASSITSISGDSLLTIGTNSKGMLTSNDEGNSWTITNNGIAAEDILSLVTQPGGRVICTTGLGIFYKDAADTLWHATNPITGFYPGNKLYNDVAGNVFVAVDVTFGSPYPLGKSTDNGLTFAMDSNGFSNIGGSGFYIDETGTRYFYNYYATPSNTLTIWKSSLGSSIWSLDTAGLPLLTSSGLGVRAMCSDQQGNLYAAISEQSGVSVYHRAMNGTAWAMDNGLFLPTTIAPMASNPSIGIVAASGTDLYRRAANGWVSLNTVHAAGSEVNGYSGGVGALSVDGKGVIYAAFANYSQPDSNGIYLSKDTGATWQLAGLMGYNITGLVSAGDTTYALTSGHWGYMLAGNGVTAIGQVTPASADDINVFPNPSLSGNWNLQTGNEWQGSHFEICDVNGRVVYKGSINGGFTQVNATSLASGVYLLRVMSDKDSICKWLVK